VNEGVGGDFKNSPTVFFFLASGWFQQTLELECC